VPADYDAWLAEVAPTDPQDPGVRPAGADAFLRDVFDRLGPVSREVLRTEGERVAIQLATQAVELVLHDLRVTTIARPTITVLSDETGALIVTYDGSHSTPVMMSMRHPEATCEIAAYLQSEIAEDLWTAWPACRAHGSGLHPMHADGDAFWYCRAGNHQVAAIGGLR